MSKQIVAPMEPKKEPQRDTPSLAENISPDSDKEESLDEPMEINFVKKKEPTTSTTTIKCKIGRLKIPAMTVDSRAEPPIITKNIVDRIKVKIDKSEKYDLSGIFLKYPSHPPHPSHSSDSLLFSSLFPYFILFCYIFLWRIYVEDCGGYMGDS
ncbi:hypothetical protein RhiirB3_451474 [Rhizophagus irregularis]|nr:hypothetical protein RhiirB3_451474 [Rhizophagus irregularis]